MSKSAVVISMLLVLLSFACLKLQLSVTPYIQYINGGSFEKDRSCICFKEFRSIVTFLEVVNTAINDS